MALEHKDGFRKGSGKTRGIVMGIRETKEVSGMQRIQKGIEQSRAVLRGPGNSMEVHRMDGRTERPTGVTDADAGRVPNGKKELKEPSRELGNGSGGVLSGPWRPKKPWR